MAIEVLRRAQCFEEALHLSKKHNLFTTFLRIQIEDKQENQTIEQAVKFGALLGEGGSFSFHFTQRNRERAHVGE